MIFALKRAAKGNQYIQKVLFQSIVLEIYLFNYDNFNFKYRFEFFTKIFFKPFKTFFISSKWPVVLLKLSLVFSKIWQEPKFKMGLKNTR